MAKIAALPSLSIIAGFRGKVDYYVNHQTCDPELAGEGIPCARKWPRSPGHSRAPASEAHWQAWTEASRLWSTLTPEIQAQYNSMASGSGMSGRDLMTRGYISGIYRYEPPV